MMTRVLTTRRRFIAGSSAIAASTGLITAPARAAQFELRAGSFQPLGHPSTVRQTQMWAAIERETNGRVKTQFFPNSILGSDSAQLGQLRTGALNFFLLSLANLASVVPVADVAFTGFAFKDSADAVRVMDGPLGAYVRTEADAKGIHIIPGSWDSGMNQIGSTPRAIKVPDDMHGFKIRVPEGRITTDLFRTLGASPTPVSLNELYTALQTHLVDGEGIALINIDALRFYEINRYLSIANYGWAGIWLSANGDTWKSLPPDIQAIIERNAMKAVIAERRDAKLLNQSLVEKLTRRGLAVNVVDQGPFRAMLKPYYETWAKNFGPTVWGLLQTGLGHTLV